MIYVKGLSLMLDTHLRDVIPYVDTKALLPPIAFL